MAPERGAHDGFTFAPLVRGDLTLLHDWLNRPHVAEWWLGNPTRAEVEEDFGAELDRHAGSDAWRAYIAWHGERPVGFIQSYNAVASHADGWWLEERDPGVYGIDQFLADADDLGRGLGTAMIRAFVDRLLTDPAVTRVQTDPDPANARAIRCYEKVGFRAVGEIVTLDGPALLMRLDR